MFLFGMREERPFAAAVLMVIAIFLGGQIHLLVGLVLGVLALQVIGEMLGW